VDDRDRPDRAQPGNRVVGRRLASGQHEPDRGQNQPRQPPHPTHHDLSHPRKTFLGQSHVGKRSRLAE
jgi:hypothetical protein